VFYQNDGFGKSGLDGITAALKKQKLAPSAVGSVERNSLDVAKAVDAIAKVTPQAVIMVTLYKPTAAFVKAMKNANQHPMLMALSPVSAELLVQELGPDARGIGVSQVATYPWNNVVPVVRDYQKLSEKGIYSYYGMEAYLMAKTMIESLKRAGKDLNREKLVTSLESMSNTDLGGYRINYGPGNRLGSHFAELTVIGPGGKVLK
jgi:branched-chain amino acid transport system substrate-binding protein